MLAESCLTFKNYIVKTINFSVNEKFDFNGGSSIEIIPEFKRQINKIDDDNVTVNLIFSISNENNDMPFSIKIDIEGVFHLKNWEQPDQISFVSLNTFAILFPYLRALVSTITANANISSYVLPIMNIAALFNEEIQ